MNDTYSAASGEGIYAGMIAPDAVPSWISAQAASTWGTIPATNTILSLDPKPDITINPNFPSDPEWYGSTSKWPGIISAWNGFVHDFINSKLRTGLVGGHTDYAGNDELEIMYNTESPFWRRIRRPSGAIGNLLITDDDQEATGNYSDGQPRSMHSYNKQRYVPNLGLVVAVQGGVSWSGQTDVNRPLVYDDDGLFIYAGATNTNLTGMTSGSGACYDPTRHCMYVRGTNTGKMQKYDIATNTWSELGASAIAIGGYAALEYIPEHDCILYTSEGLATGLAVFDLVTNTLHQPPVSGSTAGMAKPSGRCQPRYVRAGEFAFWDNSTNTTQINRLRFSGNPRTATWTIDQYPVAASNSVTPSAKTPNGTYGRFFVDTQLKIMCVINAINQPIYFYRYV